MTLIVDRVTYSTALRPVLLDTQQVGCTVVVSIIPYHEPLVYVVPEVSISNLRFETVVLVLISLTAVLCFRLFTSPLKVANPQGLTRISG
jgi:hypothetical protein